MYVQFGELVSKKTAAQGAGLSFLYAGGCRFEWHYWWTCGCTLASVLVSAFAITCTALSIANECRINPLKKTKDPWHWTCFQGACMQAWWDGSSIFVWQVKPPKPRYEPKLWQRRAAAMSFSRTQKKSKIIQDASSPCVAWFACSLSSPVQ